MQVWKKIVERFCTVATVITLTFLGLFAYLMVTGQERPVDLIDFMKLTVPLYFGTQIKQKERSDS